MSTRADHLVKIGVLLGSTTLGSRWQFRSNGFAATVKQRVDRILTAD